MKASTVHSLHSMPGGAVDAELERGEEGRRARVDEAGAVPGVAQEVGEDGRAQLVEDGRQHAEDIVARSEGKASSRTRSWSDILFMMA